MKNWKTTSAGITMIVGGITGLYFAIKTQTVNEGTITATLTAVLGGIGLIYAKDNNVTGGSVQQ